MVNEDFLKTWVSDKLMSLMGYSKNVVVQYVIRLSKDSSSPADLMGKLEEFGLSSSNDTRAFAEEIFVKVPHKQSGLSSYCKEEIEATKLAKKQMSYKLLDADDEDEKDAQVSRRDSSHEVTKGGGHQKRFRKKYESHGSDSDEHFEPDNERQVRSHLTQEDDLMSEEAMIRDQEERLQLERNMREKDQARTHKVTDSKLTKDQEEEMIRRAKALEENDMADLRKTSRQVYLQKRRDKKLLEIRDDIIDHEYIFQDVKLTDAEERDLRNKKQIYELAKGHLDEADKIEEYRMPEAYDQEGGVNQEKRFAVAMQRYRDSGASDKMNQVAWEEHQIDMFLKMELISSRRRSWMEVSLKMRCPRNKVLQKQKPCFKSCRNKENLCQYILIERIFSRLLMIIRFITPYSYLFYIYVKLYLCRI